MSASKFRHIGRVTSKDQGAVVVTLDKLAACEGCKAKGQCSSSVGADGKSSVMRVATPYAENFKVGELVSISITYRVGVIAVLFTYIIPLIVFLGALVALVLCGAAEGLSALTAFVVVAIYYGVVYLLRERFERVVDFGIEKSRE